MKKFHITLLLIICTTTFVLTAKVAPLKDLLKPDSLVLYQDNIYITEGVEIYIYSLKDFSLLKKFGKQGEGPGEFMVGQMSAGKIYLIPHDDHLIINSLKKVSYFTKDGKFIKETRVGAGSSFTPLGDKFVAYGIITGNEGVSTTINIHHPDFKLEKEIYRVARAKIGQELDPVALMINPLFYISGNKIFVGGVKGLIEAFDSTGKKLFTLQHPFEKIEFTAQHKEKFVNDFSNHPRYKSLYQVIKSMIKYPEYFPLIRHFLVADNKIYVLTYKEINNKCQFVVFDGSGKFLNQLMLPVKEKDALEPFPFTFKNEKFYQAVEDEEGCKLHIIDIKKTPSK